MKILQTSVDEIIFHDGHERSHLTEHQALVASCLKLRQDAIQ